MQCVSPATSDIQLSQKSSGELWDTNALGRAIEPSVQCNEAKLRQSLGCKFSRYRSDSPKLHQSLILPVGHNPHLQGAHSHKDSWRQLLVTPSQTKTSIGWRVLNLST